MDPVRERVILGVEDDELELLVEGRLAVAEDLEDLEGDVDLEE